MRGSGYSAFNNDRPDPDRDMLLPILLFLSSLLFMAVQASSASWKVWISGNQDLDQSVGGF
jgi:hypothetical protein